MKLKILHLEDAPDDADFVQRALLKGHLNFETLVVSNKDSFIRGINEYKPDIVLSDHSLPSFNSYEALSIFKEYNLNIPFILITATISEDFAVDIMKRGADDYILKDRLERLPSALQSALDKVKLANDHKENLKKLDKASAEKNIILESIQDGFYALDLNWIVTYWNKEAENILGKRMEDIIGKNVWEEYPESVGTISYINFHKAMKENRVQHYERYHEGLKVWLEVIAYPSAIGLSVYFKEISERKLAELERMDMVNDILQRNKELEQFSYIISHNLRSPVANISGLAKELTRENLEAADITKLSEHLVTSANQLDHVIIDLNQILQAKKGINERKEMVNLTELVDDILKSMSNGVEKEDLKISVDFTAGNEMLTVRSYIYSIFHNLISNGIKYRSPDKQVVLKIKAEKREDVFLISFKDNGLGIDLKRHGDQLFGLYKRFHTQVEGKGMGLFMVKTQVESLGGKISVNSKVDVGTTFKIEFKFL